MNNTFSSSLSHPRPRNDGTTLLELAAALAVFTTLVLVAVQSLLHSRRLSFESELYRIARQAAHNELERLKSLPFPELARAANGHEFSVNDLPARSGEAAAIGTVRVFLDEDDSDSPAFSGAGFDLDGSGTRDDTLTVDSRYRVLPVRIDVLWESSGVVNRYRLDAVVSSRNDFMRMEG